MKNISVKSYIAGLVTASLISGGVVYAQTQQITARLNEVNLVVSNEPLYADTILYEGTTFVPLRTMSGIFGKSVHWDGETSTAYIDSDDAYNSRNYVPYEGPPSPTPQKYEYIFALTDEQIREAATEWERHTELNPDTIRDLPDGTVTYENYKYPTEITFNNLENRLRIDITEGHTPFRAQINTPYKEIAMRYARNVRSDGSITDYTFDDAKKDYESYLENKIIEFEFKFLENKNFETETIVFYSQDGTMVEVPSSNSFENINSGLRWYVVKGRMRQDMIDPYKPITIEAYVNEQKTTLTVNLSDYF